MSFGNQVWVGQCGTTNKTFSSSSLILHRGLNAETNNATEPDVIMNLTADDITTSSVVLNWTKPNGQSSRYRIEYEDKNVTTENTSIRINDLIPGAQYTFKVFAVAADHVTEGRSDQISLYTKPDVIKNLKVNNISTSSVFLTWDKPDGNIYFFKLQWTDNQTSGNSTTINVSSNITGLIAGVNYTFCITAVAEDNSTEGQALCISQFTKPDVIRDLTVSEITTSSVFLTWKEPDGMRSFFKLQWTSDDSTTNTSYNITGLTAGVNYTFCITAVAADSSTGGTVCVSLYTKPDVIMNLKPDDITTSSVLLSWTKPIGQSSRYRVEYEYKNVTNENTSVGINDLIPGAQYTFKVFAVAADHVTEGRSSQISLYTKPDVISNLTVKNITTSSVFLTWNEPGGNRDFFRIHWTGDQESGNSKTNDTSYNITGLTAGVNHTFCITAVAADNLTEGGTSCTSQFTKPDVIENLIINEVTTSSVFLKWDKPAGKSDFFRIQWNEKKTYVTNNDTTYLITDLTAGVNHTFCITAVAADNSTEGEMFCISKYTKPNVIKNLVSEITTSSVYLRWEEPVGNRSFFKLQWTEDQAIGISTTNTFYNITGLTAGVNYTFIITAVAADNSTEGEPVVTSNYTKPDVIMNLTADGITTSSVLLNWTKPNGQSSCYRVEYGDKNVTTENTSITINDLIPGAQYTFKVFAVAADHVTEGRSDQISLYTKPDVIRNLTVSEITTSSVLLTWDEPIGNRYFFKLQWTGDQASGNSTTTNTSYLITDLTAGVNYTFMITAVAEDNSTGETIFISQYSKPDVIRNLTANNISTSSVFLTWIEPAGNRDFFKIQWTDNQTSRNSTTTNTSYLITDLTAGVNYTICITAVAADSSTEGDAFCISQYTKPDVIRNLTVAHFTISSVFLTWDEPIGNRSSFKLQWTGDQASGNSATTNTSYNITDLTAGVNYTFCITAVAEDNSTGETVCILQYTKPDVIRNLTVSEITTASVLLRWDEPIGIRFVFKLQWTGDQASGNSTTNDTFYNITGLTAGVNYTFIITAVAADNSTEGEPVITSNYTKPDVIMYLKAEDITTSTVLLSWTKPNGQSSRYRVEYGDKNVTIENTFIKINDLTPGAQYTFKVFAVAADLVTEGRSSQISLYTKPDVIRNLTVFEITTSSVLLTWDEPIGNRYFFKLQWTGDEASGNSTTTNTSYLITGLTAGVNYTFMITAVAEDNSTGETIFISQYSKPDVIRNLTANNISTSSVFLTWIEPAGNRDFFKIQWTDNQTSRNSTTTNTSYNITDLTSGVSYTICITAVAEDSSTEGDAFCISQYTKPDVIRNLTVAHFTISSVFLTWDEPIGNRSSFKLQWTGDQASGNSATTNTSYNITDLTAGVNYTFCITAVAEDNSTGETVCILQYTKPDVIRNLTVNNITTSSVFLSWDEPIGNRSFYKIQWTDNQTSRNSTTTNTSYLITGLTAGANHTFCITAVAADRSTEGETVCISKFTKPNVIRNLTVPGITTSSVYLRWDEPIGNRYFFKLKWTGDKTSGNSATTNTFYLITGLTAGVNYTFMITAVAADHSTEGDSVVISKYTKPDVIMNLKPDDITTSSVVLNWTKPNGQSSRYRVEYEAKNKTTENTSIRINDLTPGAQYTFKVFAVAADHVTEGRSNQISLYTKPNMIKNLTVSEITTSSVYLTWEEPIGNRSFFKLQWTGDKTSGNSTTNDTFYNITDLTAGVSYTFIITAVAADNSTEGETVVTSKYTKPDVIMNLTADGITTSSVLLSWTKPNGQSSCYRVEYGDKNVTIENTFITINDLIPGAQHTFKVFAVAADHVTEGRSDQISLYTKPDVIRNLIKKNTTTSSVFLTWDEPIGKRSFFKLQWTGDQKSGNSTTTNTFYNIIGLTAGVNYTFIITAVAADSLTEGGTVCISQYTRPGVIRNFTASDITTSSVFLKWNEPAGKRDFFRIQWTEKRTYVITNDTSYRITGLNAGVNYTFCIAAVAADKSAEGQAICISHYTESVSNTGLIVGIVFGVIFFLFIITLILFLYLKRRTKKQSPDIPVHTISNVALRIEDYEEYFKRKHADSNCGFAEEYEELKTVGTAQSKSAALAVENKAKNRYSNVLPYDSSRVKLSICGGPFDDYINANYIPGYNSKKEFIAAQGPLPVTVNEFWRMVWEKNVYTIVMLTRCNEMGRVKCEKYWPSGSNHYHNNSVETTSEIELESWTIRDFKIKNVKTAETRYVRQFHFTAWPDHGVPETTEILIDFRHLVREHMDQYSRHSPTVVHCSAGVGRTGTFIAIDHLIFQIERDSMVDVYGIVNDMRMHRPLMVQTEEQYVYLHQCAYDIIRSRTGTNVDLIYQNAAALNVYENVK
ncbi:receptor-type tyrosine-protein phosphatase eta-like [Garra rufa]|uniref:receptor-type tyrosine-protein phosphatase eta-like n=1 Tax=Garra rufa TaxID=137080 RepID=UPI003CCEA5D0